MSNNSEDWIFGLTSDELSAIQELSLSLPNNNPRMDHPPGFAPLPRLSACPPLSKSECGVGSSSAGTPALPPPLEVCLRSIWPRVYCYCSIDVVRTNSFPDYPERSGDVLFSYYLQALDSHTTAAICTCKFLVPPAVHPMSMVWM